MQGDYTQFSEEDLTRENLINNTDFINDASRFLADREDYFSLDAEDIYDRYLEHFRYQNVNEVTAVRDMYQAQAYERDGDQEGLDTMGRLMSTFDRQDSEFTDETITDYLGGVFTAPSTYAGMFSFGAGKAGALAAQQGIKYGIKELIKGGARAQGARGRISQKAIEEGTKLMSSQGIRNRLASAKQGFLGGGYKTALGAGVVDGGGAAGTAAAQEKTRVVTDQQDEIDYSTIALSGALGMTPGAILGGAIGTKKAITSNIAEQYAVKELHKKRDAVNDIYKKVTQKKLGKRGFEGTAQRLLTKRLKKSLAETAGNYNLNVGKRIKKGLTPTAKFLEKGTIVGLDDKIIANIAAAGAELMNKIGPRLGVTKGSKEDLQERITSRIARGLMSGTKEQQEKLVDSFLGTLKKYNLSSSEFGALYLAEISQAGRTLGTQGRLSKKYYEDMMGELNGLDKALFTLGEGTEAARKKLIESKDRGKFLNKTGDFFRTLNKTRIGLMTVQAATTVRNTTNGYLRNYIYALDNFGMGAYNVLNGLRKQKFGDAEAKEIGKYAVAEGKAQLKTGTQSVFLKDMVMGLQSEDTAILMRVFKDPVLGNSDRAKQLFRELGDIGNVVGNENSRMMKAARWGNYFNTMSDNLFKSAIFSREMDKMIKADIMYVDGKAVSRGFKAKGINNLSDLVSKGKMKMMDDKSIAQAMTDAMDFTYQTGNFRGREGGFNKLAATFIDGMSTQLGSAFVPFPRYMVNAFRFFYEHAPILGQINMGNILNKSSNAERFAKQFTGLSMLTAFYGMREHFGDENTGPYQYKNPFGHGTFDARAALGPFMPFAALADYIYTLGKPNGWLEKNTWFGRLHDNENVTQSINIRELVTAISGGAFGRAGVSLDLLDGLVNIATKEANLSDMSRMEETMAKFVGNYLSTYTVGAGMLKDIYAAVDPDYRLLTDSTDVAFFPYVFKQATRAFPFEAHADGDGFFERPAATSPYKSTGIRNHMPLFRQITGLTPQEERNDANKELDRLDIDYVQIAPRKLKSPSLNRDARQYVGTAIEKYLSEYVNSPDYKGLKTDALKKKFLKKELDGIRTEAIAYVLDEQDWDTPKDILEKNKARFFKLRSIDRQIIEEKWHELNPNQDIELEDFDDLLTIAKGYGFIK